MTLSRRTILKAAAAFTSLVSVNTLYNPLLRAAGFQTTFAHGNISVHPISHASMVINTPSGAIYIDPVGGAGKYAALPAAALILLTHHHADHFDITTLQSITDNASSLIVNPTVMDSLPANLKLRAVAIENGESHEALGITFNAIPAYNLAVDRLKFHPKGRDNGYVFNVGGKNIYVAGDTEAIPEMRALTDIDIAFIPMNIPDTMNVEQAASAVLDFAPKTVYPYHFEGSDVSLFERLVNAGNKDIRIIKAAWYR